jgi:hypothetical protein
MCFLPFFTLVSLSRKHNDKALIVSFKELLTILIGHYSKANGLLSRIRIGSPLPHPYKHTIINPNSKITLAMNVFLFRDTIALTTDLSFITVGSVKSLSSYSYFSSRLTR